MRNVITPMRSGGNAGKPTARGAEFLSGEKMSQKAKASSRKATGNRLDRACAHAERRQTWDRASDWWKPLNELPAAGIS